MTQNPISPILGLDMDAYRIQKISLEEAVKQIRHQQLKIKLSA